MLKAPKIEPVAVGAQQSGKQTVSNPTGKKKTKVSNPKAKGVSKGTEQGDSSEHEILIEGQIGKQHEDPEVWADVKSGKKKGFSIHGHRLREVVFVDG